MYTAPLPPARFTRIYVVILVNSRLKYVAKLRSYVTKLVKYVS